VTANYNMNVGQYMVIIYSTWFCVILRSFG